MARQFMSALDLYHHQRRHFAAIGRDARKLHEELARRGLADAKELTSGGDGAQGPTRKAWLARMGHPFARGASAAASTPGGLKRGLSKSKGSARNLPIGMISGQLHRTIKLVRLSGGVQSFGITSSAEHAKYILHPAGTKKMVGRGYGGVLGQNAPRTGEVVRRWRARNKALIDTLKQRQRT